MTVEEQRVLRDVLAAELNSRKEWDISSGERELLAKLDREVKENAYYIEACDPYATDRNRKR